MSNGEVKRLWIKNEDGLVDVFNVRKHVLDYKPEGFDEKTPLGPRYIEVMRVEDHERIVAQKDREIQHWRGVYMSRPLAKCYEIAQEQIATQKRVIEKLKGMVSHYETCATVDRYDDEEVPCDCGLEKELAAIEKGEK